MSELKNIFLKGSGETLAYGYAGPQPQGGKGLPSRNPKEHAKYLASKFNEIWEKGQLLNEQRKVATLPTYSGVYLEVKGQEKYELITKSLENVQQGVRLCNVREINGVTHATVYIPHHKKAFFLKKINDYYENESNKKLMESIEEISLALVEALWIGDRSKIPVKASRWCEVWLIHDKNQDPRNLAKDFFEKCHEKNIRYKEDIIVFPERVVVGISANQQQILELQYQFGLIAEIRAMATPASFYTENLNHSEQHEWIDELNSRTLYNTNSGISIGILDTGINQAHPLLSPVLNEKDMHTIFPDAIKADRSRDGHGTRMAGIATYFNLEEKLELQEQIVINHHLESIRMFDYRLPHLEELYGAKTAEAILLPEIENPDQKRVVCMAITSEDSDVVKDGRPSSWSGALDSLAIGRYDSEDTEPRLIVVSAGNTKIPEIKDQGNYEVAVANHSVEDPGQAWNTLTVGAYTEKAIIPDHEDYKNYRPIAEAGTYSPYTSTSLTWSRIWPLKPEIVLEGGNLAYSEEDKDYSNFDDLELLTTNKDFHFRKPFTTISMTSSATAQASWIAANIWSEYPEIWSETVRALMVHSAEWPSSMLRKLFGEPGERQLSRSDYSHLLRTVGYGVPSLERAIHCMQNSVNMVIEEEIQPFIKEDRPKMHEMHIHEIPWPEDVLLSLGDTPVEMRVTLSYYIEPAPGEVGWKDKYRYPSHRLYFDVNNTSEDKDNFLKRINKEARENAKDKGHVQNDSSRWLIGATVRDVGSIHSDIWKGNASDLAENRYIAVFPGTGWWHSRPHLDRVDSVARYSLIVSVSTPDESIDLYTPILTKINNRIPVKTEIKY